MRLAVILRILSRLLIVSAASLFVPLGVGIFYGESHLLYWILPAVGAIAIALSLQALPMMRRQRLENLRRREGFVAVTMGWIVLTLPTAVAYYFSGEFAGFAEAFFESMSGFTTTGATVVRDIEALPTSIIFQRSFSHWIGGMGIIVLSVAILPELGVGGMQLFSAESSGIGSDKLAPRIRSTARRLWTIYVFMTGIETVLLLFGGMSFLEALLHSFGTIATGGFSSRNASIAAWDSAYIDFVITVFMFLSGISFALQYRAFMGGKPMRLLQSPEVRWYTYITFAAIGIVTWSLLSNDIYDNFGTAYRYASFQVVSILTTTGYGTADFDAWPDASRLLLVLLMLIGGCAGSTAGGSKVVRLYVVAKHAALQLKRLVRPRLVSVIQLGRREVTGETIEGILGFYLLYMGALIIGGFAMTVMGMDLVSGFTASVSALNSIGPGLGTVGAARNFADVPHAGMYLLSFGMLLGRLEIYTVIVLFSPHFWRKG